MNEVIVIASSIWRRYMRMGVVYFLLASTLVIIAAMNLYGTLTMNEERMLMVDISMLMTTVAGLLATLTVSFDVPRELRNGVASTLLVKPLGRTQYLAGKLLGTGGVAVMVAAGVSAGFFVIHHLCFTGLPLAIVQSHALILASMIPMAALAVLFASFLPEVPAALAAAAASWFAFSTGMLGKIPFVYGGLLPDLNLFNIRAEAAYGLEVGWTYVLLALVWGIVFAIGANALAAAIFAYRDVK